MGNTIAPGNQLPSGKVSFLFTDIEGSTRLACELGELYRQVLGDHRRLLRAVFTTYAGCELLTEGDSFFIAFTHAETAVRAALEAQSALRSHEWPLIANWPEPARPKVRMGIHTGQAVPDQYGYASSAVHRAARVCAAAHGDQILCSASTAQAIHGVEALAEVTDLGLYKLRGFNDVERLHQLTELGTHVTFPAPATKRQHDNLRTFEDPFVGRKKELQTLEEALLSHRHTSVTGIPQAGKTRVICELAKRVADKFPDGVWYTEIGSEEAAEDALARVLGIRAEPFRTTRDTLTDRLCDKQCLLIFDEATTEDADYVRHTLLNCPDVTILCGATWPLGLAGEVKWPLPTMTIADAAELLRNRASAAGGGCDIDDCSALAALVDGFLPAIQLLAQWVPLVGVSYLSTFLEKNPWKILDKNRGLSSMLDEVFVELTEPASNLLLTLSEQDSARVGELQQLGNDSADVLNALLELVDLSLVDSILGPDEASYRLPKPVRWYAQARRSAMIRPRAFNQQVFADTAWQIGLPPLRRQRLTVAIIHDDEPLSIQFDSPPVR